MMSLYDLEDYIYDKPGRTTWKPSGKCLRYPGRKTFDQVTIVKTIHDPESTLSKRKLRRVLADRSDGFCPQVPYSMNKRKRWNISPASLLANQSADLPELCILNRRTTFLHLVGRDLFSSITQFRVFENDAITTLSAAGKQQTIPLLAPGYCTVHWFGSERASVASKSPANPMFVFFFEVKKDEDILRIRVNTTGQFTALKSKASLIMLLETRKNFPSLFNDLLEFVYKLEKPFPPESSQRFKTYKDNFMLKVNSANFASVATRADVFEQSEFLRPYYKNYGLESGLKPKARLNFILTRDGMICRECVAFTIIHEMRLNRLPFNIPFVADYKSSPLDLLYAVLPLPVMSLLVKTSYEYFQALEDDNVYMTECPKCCTPLTTNVTNVAVSAQTVTAAFAIDANGNHIGHSVVMISMNGARNGTNNVNFIPFPPVKFCRKSSFYQVPEFGPHFTFCRQKYVQSWNGATRQCNGCYDQNGLIRPADFGAWPYTPRFRKEYHPNFEKYGNPVQPDYLKQKKLISKRYAEICAEVRRFRFDEVRRKEYEDAVRKQFASKAEQLHMIDLRKTVGGCQLKDARRKSCVTEIISTLVLPKCLENYLKSGSWTVKREKFSGHARLSRVPRLDLGQLRLHHQKKRRKIRKKRNIVKIKRRLLAKNLGKRNPRRKLVSYKNSRENALDKLLLEFAVMLSL
ncbi:unnamed protein product [Cylicocyclus nassatus]|uniref:Uncharacterized protein n=1 Tax=Cylicocyclus nassatus TaxID=53992 RepID=A0AA36GRD2_CYLNA|nr:unnamed protein product [Cylicocyclus nassatus]